MGHISDVVDGQQRITTISILLCAIRDYLSDHFDEVDIGNRVERIDRSLWLVDRDGQRHGLRLKPGNLDQESYQNLIQHRSEDIENGHISAAYEYFYEQINDQLNDLDKIRNLHDKVHDQLIYVSITAQDHSDAYQLFEAMNNRGPTLSPIGLMKNYLLMESAQRHSVNEDRIEELWGGVIKNIDSIPDLNNPGITFFRQYFMSSPTVGINEKITTKNLYEPYFRDIIEETNDIESLLEEIMEQSGLYRDLLTQNINKFSSGENAEISRLLRDARIVSITPFTLFLRAFSEPKT